MFNQKHFSGSALKQFEIFTKQGMSENFIQLL